MIKRYVVRGEKKGRKIRGEQQGTLYTIRGEQKRYLVPEKGGTNVQYDKDKGLTRRNLVYDEGRTASSNSSSRGIVTKTLC